MIRCLNCGTEQPETDQYCDECGAKLMPRGGRTLIPAATEERLKRPPEPDYEPVRRPPKTLASMPAEPPTIPSAVRPVVESTAKAPARFVVTRSGRVGHEFALTGTQWLIGRWDPDHGIFPDIDLDPDDPEANISRRHATIVLQHGQYLIEDLGSTNGTFINRGHRLIPGRRYLLQDGDELIIGKTFLKFMIG